MTNAMKTAMTARALNRAATALHVRRKQPSLKARIPVHVRLHPDAMTVARAQRPHTATRKLTTTMTLNHRVNLKKITNHVPMRTWVRKAVSTPLATNPAAALAVNPTQP